MRATRTFLAIAVATALASGCGSKGKVADKASFKVFPKDSDLLVGINGAKARGASQVDQVLRQAPPRVAAVIAKLKSCGIDVVKGLDTAFIAGNSKTQRGVISIKGFSKSQIEQCGQVAKELALGTNGNLTSMTVNGRPVNLAWVNDSTFLTGPNWSGKDLQNLAGGNGGADGNRDLMGLVGEVDGDAALWFVFAPPKDSPLLGAMSSMGGPVQALFGSVSVSGGGLTIHIGVRSKDADSASQIAAAIKMVLPQVEGLAGKEIGAMAKKVEVSSSGDKVKLKVSLSKDDLAALQKMAPMAAGMLGGG